MVFQNYALYPHMTVRENMGFALKLARDDKAEIDRKVEEAARTLDLEGAPRPPAGATSPAASASAWRWEGRSSATRKRS